jgi:hypothetical protein
MRSGDPTTCEVCTAAGTTNFALASPIDDALFLQKYLTQGLRIDLTVRVDAYGVAMKTEPALHPALSAAVDPFGKALNDRIFGSAVFPPGLQETLLGWRDPGGLRQLVNVSANVR